MVAGQPSLRRTAMVGSGRRKGRRRVWKLGGVGDKARRLKHCFLLARKRRGWFFKQLTMSQHKSIKPPGGNVKRRNVLKRFERIDLLKKRGQWKDGDRVVSLVKTKPDE